MGEGGFPGGGDIIESLSPTAIDEMGIRQDKGGIRSRVGGWSWKGTQAEGTAGAKAQGNQQSGLLGKSEQLGAAEAPGGGDGRPGSQGWTTEA